MKLIYSSPDVVAVGFVRSLLDSADIPYEVRNEAVAQVMVGFPFAPELSVNDEDAEEAIRLIAESREG